MGEPRSTTHQASDGVPAHVVREFETKRSRFALVIPVINEGERLIRQLDRLRSVASQIDVVVADGGSTDGSTADDELVPRGVRALLVKTGPGKLSAQLRMAFGYCLEQGYDGVITMDGNDKDGEDGVPRIVDALDSGADFVQGSRFVRGGTAVNTPRSRLIGIRLVHAPATSVAARHWYTDTTNGFRGHSRRLLTDDRVQVFRDVFDSYELLAYLPIRAARLGFDCREVPTSRSYPTGETPTKIHGWAGNRRVLAILGRACLGRFNPGRTTADIDRD